MEEKLRKKKRKSPTTRKGTTKLYGVYSNRDFGEPLIRPSIAGFLSEVRKEIEKQGLDELLP